jgi:hypothetical protein
MAGLLGSEVQPDGAPQVLRDVDGVDDDVDGDTAGGGLGAGTAAYRTRFCSCNKLQTRKGRSEPMHETDEWCQAGPIEDVGECAA